MIDIKNYIEKNLELENFNFENDTNYNDIKHYYNIECLKKVVTKFNH